MGVLIRREIGAEQVVIAVFIVPFEAMSGDVVDIRGRYGKAIETLPV